MRRYAYPVSFVAHLGLLMLLLLAPRTRIVMPPPQNVMSVQLVKAPPAPVVTQHAPEPAPQPPQPAEVVPRIQPRLSPAPPVAIHIEPLPLPAKPAHPADKPPIKTVDEIPAPAPAPPPNTVFDPGRPLSRDNPVYPDQAARRGLEGTVELRFTIKADGSADDIRVVKSDPPGIFDAAAIESQRTAHYHAATRDGASVDQPNCRVIFHFKAPK